jgi:hypothetical protein
MTTSGDPQKELVAAFLSEIDRDINSHSFVGGHYFHGTRAVSPEEFKVCGILSLDAVTPKLLRELRALAPDGNESFWSKFYVDESPDSGSFFSYRSKEAYSQGPYGYTVRDVLLNSISLNQWPYAQIPETVHDFINQYFHEVGIDLTDNYMESTHSAVVEFRHSPLLGFEVEAAFWYVYRMVTSRDDGGDFTVGGFDGMGDAVPASDVVRVEILEPKSIPRRPGLSG